jgi:hypothetical protein
MIDSINICKKPNFFSEIFHDMFVYRNQDEEKRRLRQTNNEIDSEVTGFK